MKAYFIRRLLLIPLTLLGITLLVFFIVRMAPGGPVVRALAQQMGGENKKSSGADREMSLTPSQILEAEEDNNRDKAIPRSYLEWLGFLPRDIEKQGKQFPEGSDTVKIALPGTIHELTIKRNDQGGADIVLPKSEPGKEGVADLPSEERPLTEEDLKGWEVRVRSPEYQIKKWDQWAQGMELIKQPEPRAILFKPGFDGLIQGSLGQSSKYQDPVGQMIRQRMPVSLFFGGLSMILIYSICLPLGMVKAIKHRSWLDNFTSLTVFTGYAVPGYALGALLVVFLAAKLRWFALGGFTSEGFGDMSIAEKIKDLAYHGTLPLICYIISSFAMMTMMMKNNLMDNLAADYVRTAIAKGTGFQRAVFRHAFRNSLIPIATTFGANLMLLVTGSILIERIFDINGFGLLTFSALLEFDEPVIMGVLFVSASLMLLGNVVSDFCVALVDPRVSYK